MKVTILISTCTLLMVQIVSCNIHRGPQRTCQGHHCALQEIQGTETQILRNLTASIATVLQGDLKVHIIHDYQNFSFQRPSNADVNQPLLPKDCTEIFSKGGTTSGYYQIQPVTPQGLYNDGISTDYPVSVYCDMDIDGGGWTVFQRRINGLVDFFRDWDDYKHGFGYLRGDYWFGLENLHKMTSTERYELRIDLEDYRGNRAYAKYSNFQVAEERMFYKLTLGSYEGSAGDSLRRHNHMYFTTRDADHDSWPQNCAQKFKGGWWYVDCVDSNLNGMYKGLQTTSNTGMGWYYWKRSWEILHKSEMKIRYVG